MLVYMNLVYCLNQKHDNSVLRMFYSVTLRPNYNRTVLFFYFFLNQNPYKHSVNDIAIEKPHMQRNVNPK